MLGPVELDGPYLSYGNLNAKLPTHLRTLSLQEGEELVNYLASLPEAQESVAWRDYLHEEMALIALCRDDHVRCRRHKQRLSDPAGFIYDQPLDSFERRMQRDLFGSSPRAWARTGLTARLNFQRMRAARRIADIDNVIERLMAG